MLRSSKSRGRDKTPEPVDAPDTADGVEKLGSPKTGKSPKTPRAKNSPKTSKERRRAKDGPNLGSGAGDESAAKIRKSPRTAAREAAEARAAEGKKATAEKKRKDEEARKKREEEKAAKERAWEAAAKERARKAVRKEEQEKTDTEREPHQKAEAERNGAGARDDTSNANRLYASGNTNTTGASSGGVATSSAAGDGRSGSTDRPTAGVYILEPGRCAQLRQQLEKLAGEKDRSEPLGLDFKARPHSRLFQDTVLAAITCVSEKLTYNGSYTFSLIGQMALSLAQLSQEDLDDQFKGQRAVRPRLHLFIPWVSPSYKHMFLVVVRTAYTAPSEGPSNSLSLPTLRIYDSEPDLISPKHHRRIMWEVRQAVQNLAWYQGPGVQLTEDLHWMPPTSPPTARQREGDGLSCGLHTILNAWTVMLQPLTINPDFVANMDFYEYTAKVVNLALGGHIGLHTIRKFLVCTKFATIPDGNAPVSVGMERTLRIQDDVALEAYYQSALARENETWRRSRCDATEPPEFSEEDIEALPPAEKERQMDEAGWQRTDAGVRADFEAYQRFVLAQMKRKGRRG